MLLDGLWVWSLKFIDTHLTGTQIAEFKQNNIIKILQVSIWEKVADKLSI